MRRQFFGTYGLVRAVGAAWLIVIATIGWRLAASPDAGWVKHDISKSIRNVRVPEKQSKIAYAATDVLNYANSGVYVSKDGGLSYQTINGTLPEKVVKDLAVHPSNVKSVFVGLLNSGVYGSTDQGATWKALNTGLTSRQATALYLNPKQPSALLLGIKGGTVFRSTNSGALWTASGKVSGDVVSFASDPKSKTIYYLGTSKGAFYKSTDGGATWTQKTTGLPGGSGGSISALAIDPVTTLNVYLSTTKKGVYKSVDGGESWVQKTSGLTNTKVNDLVLYQKSPAILYAGTTGGGVFKSTDGAGTWTQFDKLNLTDLTVLGLALDQVTGKRLFAGTNSAIFDYTLAAP